MSLDALQPFSWPGGAEGQGRSRELATCLEQKFLEKRQQSLENNNPCHCSKAFRSGLFSVGFLQLSTPLPSQQHHPVHSETPYINMSVNK